MRIYPETIREELKTLKMDSGVLEKYYFNREKKIKVFDFATLKVNRVDHNIKKDIDVVSIIKRCKNLDDKEKIFISSRIVIMKESQFILVKN